MVSSKTIIQLAKPVIPESGYNKLKEILKSGMLVQGKTVEKFESQLSKFLNIKHAIAVSSGTAALHCALFALSIEPDDEIIIPAFSFPATINVIEALGAKPVLVDISLDDFCIDHTKIADAITRRTKAIVPVHEFGMLVQMDEIRKISDEYKIKIVEDAACALGSMFMTSKAGTIGDIGCFSFHPRKIITSAEGGAVVCNDDILADRVRAFRNHGFHKSVNRYIINHYGLNYRMSELHASLGLSQVKSIKKYVAIRTKQALTYTQKLKSCETLKLPKYAKVMRPSFQTFHVLLGKEISRNEVIQSLKRFAIESNFGAHALHVIPYYKERYSYSDKDFPNALLAYRQGLALPIGPHITIKKVNYICKMLKRILTCKE